MQLWVVANRNNLTFITVCGESGNVDQSVVDGWKQHTLTPLLAKYDAADVYNLDEAALFYKMLPIKTFAVKEADIKGQKQNKARITVLFDANMCGEHKLQLLVVGKTEKPCCFKNARLPPKEDLIYKNNKKAWMTAAILEEYVRHLDHKFAATGHNVLFVIDEPNARRHSEPAGD